MTGQLDKPNQRLKCSAMHLFVLVVLVLLSLSGCGSLAGIDQTGKDNERSVHGGSNAAIAPKKQSTYVERVLTHEREENWSAAVEDLRRVVELNPACTADFDYRLGVALMKTTCALTDLQLRWLKAKAQASSGKVDEAKRTPGDGVSFDELATSGQIDSCD